MGSENFYIDKQQTNEEHRYPDKPYLTGMTMKVKMDRPYENEKHYVSPGGYEIDGKQFDFTSTYGFVQKEPDLLEIEVADPDLDSFPEAVTKEEVVRANLSGRFDEFYMYTGEANEPEINTVCVKELAFHFSDGSSIAATDQLLETVNEQFVEATKEEDYEI